MKHVKKPISLLICIILMFSMVLPASARASEYFYRTYAEATHIGNGVLRIKIDVGATETMQELGASQVIVYEKQSNGKYEPVRTYTRQDSPQLITYNRIAHAAYITHYGSPGKTYYALCTFYAKNSTGSQTLWGSSNSVNT